ncbi:DNA-binding response regulator [Adhaeribacter aerolatus]|uniref:DNA-binding response regulator n=1 Tax=Adhaeribacter aerolatus TaxID=670289 RepID=A0A512AUL1_9BACT|nr:response regulator transcription factor [Adhaeribacter aerolatus]GEO03402.1 DNA-binding response regulator [Adhaeribacter aerolatus]
MVKVAIIDEDDQHKLAYKNFIDAQRELKCACVGASVTEVLNLIANNSTVQVIIISVSDKNLSKLSPAQLRKIKETQPATEILVLADSVETKKVITLLRAGVVGYLPRHTSPEELKEAILGICQGGAYIMPVMVRKMLDYFRSQEDLEDVLTEREKEIVQCLVEGMSYKLIAFNLDVALDTVRYHLRNIYKKLNVHSKSQVISKVITGEIGL